MRADFAASLPDIGVLRSPVAWSLVYRYPVHRIGPRFLPQAPPEAPTLLLVRRDRAGEVRFAAISPLVYRLLELLGEGGRSGRTVLRALAAEAGAEGDAGFLAQGAAMLERMRAEGTLLGTRAA